MQGVVYFFNCLSSTTYLALPDSLNCSSVLLLFQQLFWMYLNCLTNSSTLLSPSTVGAWHGAVGVVVIAGGVLRFCRALINFNGNCALCEACCVAVMTTDPTAATNVALSQLGGNCPQPSTTTHPDSLGFRAWNLEFRVWSSELGSSAFQAFQFLKLALTSRSSYTHLYNI